MNCSVCNTPYEPGTMFCSNCGSRLDVQPQQPPQPQPPQQPYYQPPATADVMGVGEYMITLLLSYIPFVGLIMLLIWAFSSGVNQNKKNYARARLIYAIIGTVVWIVLFSLFIPIIVTVFETIAQYPSMDFYPYY